MAPWRAEDPDAQRAHVAAFSAEIDRRAALRLTAIAALRTAHLSALASLLADDPTALESIQGREEALAARGVTGLDGALAALRAAPRNEATGAPVHHPAGTGACPLPEEGVCCEECAGAYETADADSEETV